MAISPDRHSFYQKHPKALADEIGAFLSGGSFLTSVRGNTAVIEVSGFLFPAKIQRLNLDLQAAVANDQIENIVLNVDSGGGMVAMINEFANKIAAVEKPTAAYISAVGASGAYWLAAACDRVVIDATAQAGSIGVILTTFDWSEYDKRLGIQEISIINTDSPLKRIDITTEEGQAIVRTRLDEVANVFFGAVSTFRNMTTEAVAGLQGNMFVGNESVSVGLADSVGSLEGLIHEFNGEHTMPNGIDPKDLTAAFLKENHLAVYQEIFTAGASSRDGELNEAMAAGATAERDRLNALDGINTHGSEAAAALVAEAKGTPGKTAADIALEVLNVIEPGKAGGGTSDIAADSPEGVKPTAEQDDGEFAETDNVIKGAAERFNKGRA